MLFSYISKKDAGFGNLVENCGKMIEKQVVFQKISKMKDVFGNLVENCGEMIEKRVFFQKISKMKAGFGNLLEIRLEKCFSQRSSPERSPV